MFSGQVHAAGQMSDYQARAALNRTGWNLPAAFNYAMVEHYAQRPHHWSFSYYANDGFDHTRREGNCYTMASMFLAMARQMGYETRQVDGGVPLRRGGVNDHSWVEINVNGTWYICDPDFQQETGRNGYMLHLTYQVDLAYQKDLSANTLWLSQSVAYCMNWAVPVFLMVTGSLLLNPKKELPLEKLWKKYIRLHPSNDLGTDHQHQRVSRCRWDFWQGEYFCGLDGGYFDPVFDQWQLDAFMVPVSHGGTLCHDAFL